MSDKVLHSYGANRAKGWRAIGGQLEFTSREATFTPHRGNPKHLWAARLRDITAVEKSPRTYGLFNGGLRERLRLTLADGSSEVFVVLGLDEVISDVEPLVKAAQRGSRSA
ncbi:MAG: hypothetical protein ACTHNU_12250 [Gaiellales bacterium]